MGTPEIRYLCVDDARFHLSNRRAKIMENLETLIGGLRVIGIRGKVWIDGSFLTEKIEPNDVDILLDLEDETVQRLNPQQRADVDWLYENKESKQNTVAIPMFWSNGRLGIRPIPTANGSAPSTSACSDGFQSTK